MVITCFCLAQKPEKLWCLLELKKVNAEKVAVSGKKRTQKLYRRHSGRPGGMTVETFEQLQKRIPERIVEHAVRGMLPKGRVSFKFVILPILPSCQQGYCQMED